MNTTLAYIPNFKLKISLFFTSNYVITNKSVLGNNKYKITLTQLRRRGLGRGGGCDGRRLRHDGLRHSCERGQVLYRDGRQ